MSDELKNTQSEEETTPSQAETPVAEATEAQPETATTEAATNGTNGQTAPESPARAAAGVSLRDRADDDEFDGDDEYDDGDEFEDGDDEADEDDNNYVEGPAEYVQREKGGRARRIGSDIRVGDIDYKNIPMLSRFLDRRGRILSRRKTKVNAKVQRAIVKAIKRARHLALLPYTGDHTRIVQKRGR